MLAAGGALGTVLRYSVSGLAQRSAIGMFPWGTLAVNLTGSFLIGLLWGIFEVQNISSNFRTFLFVGILGGFTTFSTFALESLNLMRDGEIKIALTNVIASNILGILLVFGGVIASKYIINLVR